MLLVCGLVAGCGTAPAGVPNIARSVVERSRWDVIDDGAVLGQVLQLEIDDPSGPVVFYRVVDAHGRWLGHATSARRFSRRVPFREDEEDLGVWSLERGAAMLLEAAAPVTLRVVARDADARRAAK